MRFTDQLFTALNAVEIKLTEGLGRKYCVAELVPLIEQWLAGGKSTFIFDLEGVDIRDSSVFVPMLVCYQKFGGHQGQLRIRGLEGRTKDVFELLTLERFIAVDEGGTELERT